MRNHQLKFLGTVLLTSGLLICSKTPSAQAHGAVVEVNPASVEIKAAFDTGEPMSNAQVLIYSPADVATPVVKGQTDSEGRFLFSPDPDLVAAGAAENGRWEVTVRKAGHGQATNFELGDGILQRAATGSPTASSARFTPQHWLSLAAVVWGFVGTALYFKANAKQSASSRSVEPSAVVTPNVSGDVARSDVARSDR